MIRALWLVAAGVLLGLAAGAFLFRGPGDAPADEAQTARVAPDGGDASRTGPGARPDGRTTRAAFDRSSRPAPDDADAVDARRLWLARAALAAGGRRQPEFFDATDRADAAGASPSEMTATLEILPEPERGEWTKALRARHPEWPGEEVEAELTRIGGYDTPSDADVATSLELLKKDPLGLAARFVAMARDGRWSATAITPFAKWLLEAGYVDAALPFFELALERGASTGILEPLEQAAPDRVLALVLDAATRSGSANKWSYVAHLRVIAGDRAGAFDAAREAVRIEPNEDRLEELVAIDAARSVDIVREAIAASTDDETIAVLASAFEALGRTGEAMAVLRRAHDLDPSDTEWLSRMRILDVAATRRILADEIEGGRRGDAGEEQVGAYARTLLETGDAAGAYRRFEEAHRLDVSDGEWLRGMALADPTRSIPVLEEIAQKGEAIGVGALGVAYAGAGRVDEAVAKLEEAIGLTSSEEAASWARELAKIDDARGLAQIERLLEIEPENDEVWGELGDTYRELGRLDDARRAYEKALALDSTDWEWRLRVAKARY